jgi:acetyl-CoA carboxylase biotin carboxyl carrier protein
VIPSPAPIFSGIQVKSPLAGTFYRAPAPGARPFVEVGGKVEAGDQVAIVEVMKLMNSVKAPVKGTVREICVANEALVKMGQVLMVIEPS